jgi:hypothetical protein
MGSVLMTGQGDGGQVLRGKRNGDDYWFGRETEEMGNHGFVGEACPGFWMLKWPRVKWFFFFLGGGSFGLERERFMCRDVGKWRWEAAHLGFSQGKGEALVG